MFKNLRRKSSSGKIASPRTSIKYTRDQTTPSSPSSFTGGSPNGGSNKAQVRKLIRECIKTNSKTLDMSNCSIQHLPYEMTDCKQIEVLDLSWNELSVLPTWFCSTFTNLKVLKLRGNLIFELPENLFLLRDLEEIDLSCNKFEYFPRGLVSMRWLETIDISDNCLLNIPCKLLLLLLLTTDVNQPLSAADIDKMKNSLKSLDISGNSLMTLPVEFQKLKKLKTLCIDDNNFLQSEIATVSKIFEPMLRSKRDRNEVINQLVVNQQEQLGYSSTTIQTYRDKYSTSEYAERVEDEEVMNANEWEEEEEDGDDEFEDIVYPYEEDPEHSENIDNILPMDHEEDPTTPTDLKLDTKTILEVVQQQLLTPSNDQTMSNPQSPVQPLVFTPTETTDQSDSRVSTPRLSPRISTPREFIADIIMKATTPRLSTPRKSPRQQVPSTDSLPPATSDKIDDEESSGSDTETDDETDDLTRSSEDINTNNKQDPESVSSSASPPSSPLRHTTVPPLKINKPPSVPSLVLSKVATPRSLDSSFKYSPKDGTSTSANPQLTITTNAGRTRAISAAPERPKTARHRQRIIDNPNAVRPMTGDFTDSPLPRLRPLPMRKSVRNPKNLLKDRIGILIEILESERKYVKYLQLLNDLYYQPLVFNKEVLVESDHKDNLEHNPSFKKKPVAPEAILKNMFPSNLTTIITFNTSFLRTLEQRYISAVPSYQKQDTGSLKETEAVVERIKKAEESSEALSLFNMKIGDIFKKTAHFFKIYVSYLAAYERSMSIIRMQKSKSKSFDSWLKNRKRMQWSEGLDIGSLLIMPCQRTPRYQILLHNLLDNTPPDHVDFQDLSDALDLVKECATYQNTKIRETNNKMKVHQLSKLLNNPDLVQPHRRLVREGDLYLKTSKHKQRGYLFNDILILREMKKNPFGKTARQGLVLQYYLLDVKISQETPQTLVVNFVDDDGKDLGEIEIIFDSEQLKEDWKYDIKSVLKELSAKKEHMKNNNNQEKLKTLNRRSLTHRGSSPQLFPQFSTHERSQSAEVISDLKDKDKGKTHAENMKNFLSKLGISAQSVVSTSRRPRLSIAGTNFRHSLLRNNSGVLADALKELKLEDYSDESSTKSTSSTSLSSVSTSLKRHSADSIPPSTNSKSF